MSDERSGGFTEIVCVVDKSGSMESIRDDAIGGFNSFLASQRDEEGDALFTLALFDTDYEQLCDGVPIEEVEPLDEQTYRPDGSTALLDAIGRTMTAVTYRLDDAPDDQQPDQVIFVILTDGKENSSREYRRFQIADMIERARKDRGWEFMFLAANIDAFAAAKRYSIDQSRVTQFDATGDGVQSAYQSARDAVSSIRREGELSEDWREQIKREESTDEDDTTD